MLKHSQLQRLARLLQVSEHSKELLCIAWYRSVCTRSRQFAKRHAEEIKEVKHDRKNLRRLVLRKSDNLSYTSSDATMHTRRCTSQMDDHGLLLKKPLHIICAYAIVRIILPLVCGIA
jgi:hypothetical protein